MKGVLLSLMSAAVLQLRICVSYSLMPQIATRTFGLTIRLTVDPGHKKYFLSTAGSLCSWKSGCETKQISLSSSVIVCSSNSVAYATSHSLQHKHSSSDAMDRQRPQECHQVFSVLGVCGYPTTAGWTTSYLAVAASRLRSFSSVYSGSNKYSSVW